MNATVIVEQLREWAALLERGEACGVIEGLREVAADVERDQADRWADASAAFRNERPWCGWTVAFADGSDWDTTCFGLERMVGINILLTTADGRSRPVNITNWQRQMPEHVAAMRAWTDSHYDQRLNPHNDDVGRKCGIAVKELDTKEYEPLDPSREEVIPYEDIREIVVY
jgi:hypothetical protein